jgi:hypothetical protein
MISIKFLQELRWRWETLKNLTLQRGFFEEDFTFVLQLNAPPSQASAVCAILITDDRHMLLVVETFPAC